MKKIIHSISVDGAIWAEFTAYCESIAMSKSAVILMLVRKLLAGEIKL